MTPRNSMALEVLAPERAEIVPAKDAPSLDFPALLAMGDAMVRTGFLPDHIKTAAQFAAITLTGAELGMRPMRAVRSLQMVKGKVTESADSMLARFKSDGGRAVWVTLSAERAVLKLRHPNGDEHEQTFTIEDAKRAGLAGGDNWRKYPEAMLRSRAITAGLKSLGWEGGVGTYDPDEIGPFATNAAPETRPVTISEDGEDIAAAEVRMPMGRNKGVRLADMKTADLESAAEWCRDRGKFPDLVESIGEVLADRAVLGADIVPNAAAELALDDESPSRDAVREGR